jgi:hypothetical protein
MVCRKHKIFALALSITLFAVNPSFADILIGFNADGSPKYGPDPQGASGPIATPENPGWAKNPDGTLSDAQKNYTYLPNAEDKAKSDTQTASSLNSSSPDGMIQIGFNMDGSPKFGIAPQSSTQPIATPENPFWIKNSDGTQSAAEKSYVYLPNADERAKNASLLELKEIISGEIATSKFTKVKKSGLYIITSSEDISAASSTIKAIALKKGAKSQSIPLAYNSDGQIVIKASDKLKGFQIQILNDGKVLNKITL